MQRLVYALVNEARHILEEGIASKASDIDMVYLTGYGFPLHRGGPMCYADSQGLFNVVQSMKRFAAEPARRRVVLAAGAAAGQARGRGQDLHLSRTLRIARADHRNFQGHTMTQAVIVSTARTPLAKSWKGAFNMTHGATLGGHAVKARRRARRHRARRSRRRADGLRKPRRCHWHEHRAPDRVARRAADHHLGCHDQPLLLQRTCRRSRWRRSV